MRNVAILRSNLKTGGTQSNSKRVICRERRPCKRTDCSNCNRRRREYFIDRASIDIRKEQLLWHVVVNFPNNIEHNHDCWFHFRKTSRDFSKAISGRVGPFIRTFGIGEKAQNGHVHFFVNKSAIVLMRRTGKNLGLSSSNITGRRVHELEVRTLLSYFYDRNFLVVSNHPEKIKGLRVMSGSRSGMSYGYPSKKHYEELKRKAREVRFGKLGHGFNKLAKILT